MKIQKISNTPWLPAVLLVGAATIGCSMGNAPQALSPQETRDAVAKLPPQQQIDYINRSPMSAAEKEKRIAEIKAKAGIK
ncbi:MAG: hypothetical protein JST51_06650 [Armatimonadetes bacterium]|nr:hypothetical protein [Armatimonadota bacterium]